RRYAGGPECDAGERVIKSLQQGDRILPVRSADVRAETPAPDLSSADFSNVVPFARPRVVRQAPDVVPQPEAARVAAGNGARERRRLAALVGVSLALHGGVLWALSREPEPLASIGEQVISIEIVVGATAPAGVAQAPGETEAQTPPAEQPAEKQQ